MTRRLSDPSWTGEWVVERLDIAMRGSGGSTPLQDLVGIALRHNPRRAHLLVSHVLGKHVPVAPGVMQGAGAALGSLVHNAIAGPFTVVGMAETATALGHGVADALDAPYLHTTRRKVPGAVDLGTFEEVHSHATTHRLLPEDPSIVTGNETLVLVDDELSTGTTSLNFLARMQQVAPRDHYVLAALVDVRSGADRAAFDRHAAVLGARVDVVSLASGEVSVGPDVLEAGQALVTQQQQVATPRGSSGKLVGTVLHYRDCWPSHVPEGGRHGFLPRDQHAFTAAVSNLAATLDVRSGSTRVHVLGHEELMYLPMRLAAEIERLHPGASVTVSSTTRSPVLPVDEPGYPIRDALFFPAHDAPDDGPGPRFAYNLASSGMIDELVLVLDERALSPEAEGRGGLIDRVSRLVELTHVVVLPTYRPVVA